MNENKSKVIKRIQEGIKELNASELTKKEVALIMKCVLIDEDISKIPVDLLDEPRPWLIAASIDANILKNLPIALKESSNIAIAGVSQNGLALEYVIDKYKDNENVVRAAVIKNGLALQFASNRLKANREIVELAVNEDGRSLAFAVPKLKKEVRLIISSIDSTPVFCKQIPEKILNSEVIKNEFKRRYPLPLLDTNQIKSKEIVDKIKEFDCHGWSMGMDLLADFLKKANGEFSSNLLYKLAQDRYVVLSLLKRDYSLLPYSHDCYQEDKEILMEALKYDASAFSYVGTKLAKNEEFLLKVCSDNPVIIEKINEKIKDKIDFVVEILKENPHALKYFSSYGNDLQLIKYASLNNEQREKLFKETKKNLKRKYRR